MYPAAPAGAAAMSLPAEPTTPTRWLMSAVPPESDRILCCREVTLWANRDILHCGKTASFLRSDRREVGHRPCRVNRDIVPPLCATMRRSS